MRFRSSSDFVLSLRYPAAVDTDGLPPAVASGLAHVRDGAREEQLLDEAADEGGPAAVATLALSLDQLDRHGLLLRSVVVDGARLATLEPCSRYFSFAPREVRDDQPYAVSRFAYVRTDAGRMLLESPLALARIVVGDAVVLRLLHELRVPRRPGELPDVPRALVELLACADMVVPADAAEEPALRTWEFHDLLFHAASRQGRHDRPSGATWRHVNELPMPPAVAPIAAVEALELPRPDLARLRQTDPPLAAVQEDRRSIRAYGATPIALEQLGELLFRCGRVRERSVVATVSGGRRIAAEVARRPFPAAGALYELEVYAAVQTCAGLAPGLYRYDALGHRLLALPAAAADTGALLADAARGAGLQPETLQVLLILGARVPRIAWKYQSMAYAVVLKDAGVLLQTLYLAATAMGLAPCAVGSGDSDLFARAAGCVYLAETSVAEFLVGSRDGKGSSPAVTAG